MRRALIALAPLALVAALATPAHAEMNIAVGLKWAPAKYTKPVSLNQGNNLLPSFQTTDLNSYVALFFTEQIGAILSLDFGWANFSEDTPGGTGTINFNTSYFQFGFGVGAKFHLVKPARQKVSPYLFAQFFKYFAGIGRSDNASQDILTGLLSPIGFDLAFGVEYFPVRAFSIGAEVLGLRFAHADGSEPVNTGGRRAVGQNYFTWYGAVSLNYHFGLGGGGGGGGSREESPPPRRPRPRPRATEPPPEDQDDPN